VDDPSAFGVVEMADERITDFQEKPSREEARSDLINAGIYVFEPEILDHIGEGKVSIEREVFPHVLDLGLHGFRFHGYWVDYGTRDNMLLAQRIILELEGDSVGDCDLVGGVDMIQPNHIGKATISECRIGPFVYVEDGVMVEPGSEVRHSMLLEGCSIGKGATVVDSIVGPGYSIEPCAEVVGRILSTVDRDHH
jgi:mannose-1-phosphate guanylyltransferase